MGLELKKRGKSVHEAILVPHLVESSASLRALAAAPHAGDTSRCMMGCNLRRQRLALRRNRLQPLLMRATPVGV